MSITQTIQALLDSDMLKHKLTPDRNRKVLGSLSSGSMDSSETAMEEQQKTARVVWDRNTNPGSEMSLAKKEVQSRGAKASLVLNFLLLSFLLLLFSIEGWNIVQKYQDGKTYIQVCTL